MDTRLLRADIRRRDDGPPLRDVEGVPDEEFYAAVEARAAVPATVLAVIDHAHGQDIVPSRGVEQLRDIDHERGVSVLVGSRRPAVDPDIRLHIGAVED